LSLRVSQEIDAAIVELKGGGKSTRRVEEVAAESGNFSIIGEED